MLILILGLRVNSSCSLDSKSRAETEGDIEVNTEVGTEDILIQHNNIVTNMLNVILDDIFMIIYLF